MDTRVQAEGGKVFSYLGFAAKARKLCTGYNTCQLMMERHKVKLLIIAEDVGDSSRKKMESIARRNGVSCRVFGNREILSHMTGNESKGFFAVTDDNFARVISAEIDGIKSSDEEVF